MNELQKIYLNLKNKVMASKGEGDDPKSVEDAEDLLDAGPAADGVVGDSGEPALGHGDPPDHGAVSDGCDCSDEGHPRDGVHVGELGQHHRHAREREVPLHCGQLRRALGPARDLEEELPCGPSDDDQRHARPRR